MARFQIVNSKADDTDLLNMRPTTDGGFVAVFASKVITLPKGGVVETTKTSILATVFDGDGKTGVKKVGGDKTITLDGLHGLNDPVIATLDTGRFVIYQPNDDDRSNKFVVAQVFDADGKKISQTKLDGVYFNSFGEINTGFGASQRGLSFFDVFANKDDQKINTIDLKDGSIDVEKSKLQFPLVFDAGNAVHIGDASDRTKLVGATSTRDGDNASYRLVALDDITQVVKAGNIIVAFGRPTQSTNPQNEIQLLHPNIFANAALTKIKAQGGAVVGTFAEIPGVGFAMLSTTRISQPFGTVGKSFSAAQLNVFDFDGDLIATKKLPTLTGAKGVVTLRLTTLADLNADSGIRLLLSWSEERGDPAVFHNRDERWFGEVFEFDAAIKNDGTKLADSLRGFAKKDVLLGGDGNDELFGHGGDDTLKGGDGNDKIDGGAGDDILDGGNGNNSIKGGAGNDRLVGGKGKDKLDGGSGNDTMNGGKGDDKVSGGAGNDSLKGLDGDDNLDGGKCKDKLDGGNNDDRLKGGAGNDNLKGGKGKDKLDGGAGNDILDGGSANDQLIGGSGNDDLFGRDGDDTVLGGTGNDTLVGDIGNDTLQGGDGNDEIDGGVGADTIEGGLGADTTTGGKGTDRFVFKSIEDSKDENGKSDLIVDFKRTDVDKIDLRAIDAVAKTASDQGFNFIGKAGSFGSLAGELRFEFRGDQTFVLGEVTGNGETDFAFVLEGRIELVAADFLL